jgi:hypothetical protein
MKSMFGASTSKLASISYAIDTELRYSSFSDIDVCKATKATIDIEVLNFDIVVSAIQGLSTSKSNLDIDGSILLSDIKAKLFV